MERHIRVVGTLYIALGVFGVLASLVLFFVMASGVFLPKDQNSGATTMALTIAGVFLLALSIPCIIGGGGLLQHRSWARPLVIILAAFNLLSFPLGTIVGIYALWTLLKPEARAWFNPRPDLWAHPH
jgi:hypothetical protein